MALARRDTVKSRDFALSVLANTGGNEPVPVFVEGATVPLPDAKVVPGSFGETRIISYDPEKIQMEVTCGRGLADSWQARSDIPRVGRLSWMG